MPSSIPNAASSEYVSALWAIQDGLLQQYRVIFVTMQSVFLTFGGIAITRPNSVGLLALVTALVVVTMWMWLTVCPARARSVFFCQAMLLRVERGESVMQPLRCLKDFQSGLKPELRKDPDYLGLFEDGTRTSWKMNFLLPWTFVIVWALLWIVTLLPLVKIEIKLITG